MKNVLKFSLFFFFLFYNQSFQSQTVEQRNDIIKNYDLKKLFELSKEFDLDYIKDFNLGLEYIKKYNLPFDGIDSDSSYFSLKGYDSSINDVLYYKTLNNTETLSSIQTARVQNLHNGNAINRTVLGENMILGIWDGGQPLADHQNLGVSRVINKDGEFTTGSTAGAIQNGINHATHVSGTMVGNGTNNVFAKGMAPKADLWANTWDNDLTEMSLQASQGLLVSNHSYGINNRSYINLPGTFGRYTTLSRGVDLLTFNADMYLPVFSAGNDRNGIYVSGNLVMLNPAKSGFDLLTHEMVAKNPIVVSAIYGITNYVEEPNGSNNVVMSVFSQWGPTDDFRIKPDISAKGLNVYSSTGTGIANYSVLSGTSMAAPSVTGVFSLWQEIHRFYWPSSNSNSGFMKAASLKALMAHSASEAGENEGPDAKFGWGLINAEGGAKLLELASQQKAVFEEHNLLNYQQIEYDLYHDGTEPLLATICWTDPATNPVEISESIIPVLVNDLDLRIINSNTNEIYYPWRINKSWSNIYTTKGDNDVDPIEQVVLPGLALAGNYKVRITHKDELVGNSQKFSLIVSGGITEFSYSLDAKKSEFDKIIIFPNPTSDIIYLPNFNYDSIEIYDLTGNQFSINYFNDLAFIKLDLTFLDNGIYLLKVKSTMFSKVFKIVKK